MELVYLWVEEYKNIKRQGFNFSSQFKCKFYDKYKKDETLKNNCELIIKKKNNQLKNLFGKNINITATVGKNGSGKSTIQKLIFLLLFLKKNENIDMSKFIDTNKENAIINIFQDKKLINKNIFLIIKTNTGFKKISLLESINNYQQPEIKKFNTSTNNCCLHGKYTELTTKEIDFFSIHFHYMIDTWYDDYYDLWTNSIYHRTDGYDTPLLLEPYKGHEQDNNYIDISNIEYLNNGKLFDFYAQLKGNKHINSFFNPKDIWMMIDSNKIINKYEKFLDFNMSELFNSQIISLVNNKDLINLNKLYYVIKIIYSNKNIFREETVVQTMKSEINMVNLGKSDDDLITFLRKVQVEENLLLEIKKGTPETKKLEDCIQFHKFFTSNTVKLEEYKKFLVLNQTNSHHNSLEEVFNIFNKIVPWIYIEFYDGDKSYSSLSSGEKMFLSFSINMMYQIRNIELLKKQPYKTINLFLDEVEFGLHPEWQKRFIQEVLYILKNFKSKFNLFYATHSPFILSDLPKENIIFLDKVDEKTKEKYPNINISNLENAYCINVSEHIELNTFGQNIHTLLADGFFMEDGTMGEFAKSKIKEILNFLNGQGKLKTIKKKLIKSIIESIGEDFLRKKLFDLYYKHKDFKLDSKERKKQILDEKIKDLQKERDRLNNDSNRKK